ncbi:MAG: hypothetical protein ABTQ32_07605 [Myxococcaceae bacterium]
MLATESREFVGPQASRIRDETLSRRSERIHAAVLATESREFLGSQVSRDEVLAYSRSERIHVAALVADLSEFAGSQVTRNREGTVASTRRCAARDLSS